MIVLVSGLLTFWAENKTLEMFYHRFAVLYTTLLYVAISWIGWRLFKTYLGVVRYSSFVDLMKVAYANTVSTVIVLGVSLVLEHFDIAALCAFTKTEIIITFIVATLLMWAMRVVVKTLHDVTHNDQPLTRVLIYGAMTGGIGIAKNIRTQKPARYELRGFISHDKRAKNMTLLGEKVYNVDDDIAKVIEKEKIQAVLVSPLRLDDFRNNQRIQDELLHAGVKILFAQQAKEPT
jgi:FlaA1/EpsC-like NDP-sugar epimerase